MDRINHRCPLCSASVINWLIFSIGISSERMAISEIGVSFPDDTFGEESRFGIPFTVSLQVPIDGLADFWRFLQVALNTSCNQKLNLASFPGSLFLVFTRIKSN